MQIGDLSMEKNGQVKAWSNTGKIVIFFIRLFLRLSRPFFQKEWKKREEEFEENPSQFNAVDALYLGYKYYVRSPEIQWKPETLGLPNLPGKSDLLIHSGGDLMPYSNMAGVHSDELWNFGGDTFFKADLVMANLETPMFIGKPASWVPEVMLRNMYFNGSEELWNIFTGSKHKFDYLSIANNHMLDMGYDGLRTTMSFLEDRQVAYGGVQNPNGITWLSPKGYKTAIINYTYSLNALLPDPGEALKINYLRLNRFGENLDPLLSEIRLAKEMGAELVIASLHMGNAYQDYPSQQTREVVQRIFELSGPDIIFIHHPHVLQPMEYVNYRNQDGELCQGLVYYSLGDFVAYDIFCRSHLTGFARIHINGKGKDKKIVGSFEFLYLNRDFQGNFRFVTWEKAMRTSEEQGSELLYLREWYEQRAKYFFGRATF